MTESDDHQLLAEFARENSEAAFAALVQRHINLVYSTALRSVGNNHAAEEITQAVFIILARKAKYLSHKIILSGWLYQTTRLTAANFLRTEIRRQQREQEAYMQSTLNEPESEAWRQIAPLLDDALSRLGERDRNAIVLRFFENKNLNEVGLVLGASEDAAKMRVNRALEKLRKIFTKRGVTLTATLIAGAVLANSVQAAPVGLVVTVTAAATKSVAISATITTLVKGTLKLMTHTKLKLALGITTGILLASGVVTVAISQTGGDDKWTPQEIAKKSLEKYASLTSYSDTGKTVMMINGQTVDTTISNTRMERTNLFRIEWESIPPQATPTKNAVWSAGGGYFCIQAETSFSPPAWSKKEQSMKAALGYADTAAACLTDAFFNSGSAIKLFASDNGNHVKRQKDENIGSVDCYVIARVITLNNQIISVTLWIGKKDFLLHHYQCRSEQATRGPTTVFTETRENIALNQPFTKSDFIHPVSAGLKFEEAN